MLSLIWLGLSVQLMCDYPVIFKCDTAHCWSVAYAGERPKAESRRVSMSINHPKCSSLGCEEILEIVYIIVHSKHLHLMNLVRFDRSPASSNSLAAEKIWGLSWG